MTGKRAELGVRQPVGRTIGVLALGIVVKHQHHQPRAAACAGPREEIVGTSCIPREKHNA